MTIKARYPGKCYKCGGVIGVGQDIDWDKDTKKASHLKCPAKVATPVATPKAATPKAADGSQGLLVTEFPRRTRQEAPPAGYVFRSNKYGKHVTVVKVRSEFLSANDCAENGDETFGGAAYWLHTIYCRPATDEEAAPVLAAEVEAQKKKDAAARLEAIAKQTCLTGERAPKIEGTQDGRNDVDGEVLCDSFDLHGGGSRFVITSDAIWYVRNNGADGDDWSANNVRTGGAGAVGYRVPLDAGLAEEIRTLAGIVEVKK